MAEICRSAGIPIYWKRAVYDSCCNNLSRSITFADFASWWNRYFATINFHYHTTKFKIQISVKSLITDLKFILKIQSQIEYNSLKVVKD